MFRGTGCSRGTLVSSTPPRASSLVDRRRVKRIRAGATPPPPPSLPFAYAIPPGRQTDPRYRFDVPAAISFRLRFVKAASSPGFRDRSRLSNVTGELNFRSGDRVVVFTVYRETRSPIDLLLRHRRMSHESLLGRGDAMMYHPWNRANGRSL